MAGAIFSTRQGMNYFLLWKKLADGWLPAV
jgi:hypothetical protein